MTEQNTVQQNGGNIIGANFRVASQPKEARWYAKIVGDTLQVWREDRYEAAMWGPLLVDASSVDPTPIPETIFPGTPFHVQFPFAGNELSTINNFKGVVAVAAIAGTGTVMDAAGTRSRFFFDSDQRFMQGTYIGAKGQRHKGTFGFV